MRVGNYSFDFVNEVEITSTWENLTDMATVKVPKKLRYKKNGVFTDAITSGDKALWKRNDPVTISAGYNGINDLRFDGVITKIIPKLPLEFRCEDKMFLLKQTTIAKYIKPSVTIAELLKDILPPSVPFQTDDITLGKFKIEKSTVVEVLDYLKRTFGLSSFFQDGKLKVGLAYNASAVATAYPIEFEFQKNIIDDSNLDYIRDDDVRLKVVAISIKPDNKRKQIEVGDPDGELRTMPIYNVSDKDLNTLANEALQKLKYEGFRGSFTTFLQPQVKHGQAVKLIDKLIPDRNGVYLVKQVITRFGMEGGRQEITLDRKIA